MSQRNTNLFRLAIILHLISYILPFLDNDIGYEFFGKGLDAFFRQRIRNDEWILLFAFFSPIIAFPFLSWACFREAIAARWKLEFSLFALFLFLPALMTVFFVVNKPGTLRDNFIGYVIWLISFALLFIIYILKLRKAKNQDEDISRHLIEND